MNIEILAVPIVRETDGLALSSRNAYLSAGERKIAPALFQALQDVAARIRSSHEIAQAEAEGNAALLTAGFDRVDYCAVRDAETLRPIREIRAPSRVLAAAFWSHPGSIGIRYKRWFWRNFTVRRIRGAATRDDGLPSTRFAASPRPQ